MTDDELQGLLRGVQPSGPRPELRARIFAPPRPMRIWPWAAAAGLLLGIATTLQVSAGHLRHEVRSSVMQPAGDGPSEIDVLRDMFGLDEETLRAISVARGLETSRPQDRQEESTTR